MANELKGAKINGVSFQIDHEYLANKPAVVAALAALADAANNGKIVSISDGAFAVISKDVLDAITALVGAANNGKLLGIQDGALAAVSKSSLDALDDLLVAGNNGKVLSVQNGALAAVAIDTLIQEWQGGNY